MLWKDNKNVWKECEWKEKVEKARSSKLGREAKQHQNFCFISLFLVPCPVSPCGCFIQKIPRPNINLHMYTSCQVPYSSMILSPDFYMELYMEHLVTCLIPCKKSHRCVEGRDGGILGERMFWLMLLWTGNQLCPCCHPTALWILPVVLSAFWYTEISQFIHLM